MLIKNPNNSGNQNIIHNPAAQNWQQLSGWCAHFSVTDKQGKAWEPFIMGSMSPTVVLKSLTLLKFAVVNISTLSAWPRNLLDLPAAFVGLVGNVEEARANDITFIFDFFFNFSAFKTAS